MRVKIQQFLFGQNHSWSVVGKETGRALLKRGHEVDFISTDGIKESFVSKDLIQYMKPVPLGTYDMQFSYTAMKNFPSLMHTSFGGKRLGMWTYEFDVLPDGFAKYAETVDKFLVPTTWFKDVCIKNKISAEQIEVVPHGLDWDGFENAEPFELKTEKKVKIFVNFAQPHLRKNIPGTLEAFGRAFSKKDDVCLVLKVKDKKPEQKFDLSFKDEFDKFKKKYPNHAECLIIKDYIPNIASLYKACDILFMIPFAEGFFLPALEALGSGNVVITSGHGAQLDFLNNENSILISGKESRADKNALYWTSSPYASWFVPNIDEAAEKLKHTANNLEEVKSKIKLPDEKFKKHFSWDNVASMLENLCE